jgi:RHS repeat-associated protein
MTIADNKTQKLTTLVEFDIEGNDLRITDPRLIDSFQHMFDLAGRKLRVISADAGDKKVFPDVLGQPLYTWDGNGYQTHLKYDELRRPIELWVRLPDEQTDALAEKIIYGESANDPLSNLNGQVWKVYDGAGQFVNEAYDFKGNLLKVTRRLLKERQDVKPRWPADNARGFDGASADTRLETSSYTIETKYDALSRVIRNQTPDGTFQVPVYNEAGLLESLKVIRAGQERQETIYVKHIDYDEKGRRTCIQYGNDVTTRYTYDPETFRLVRALTVRAGNQIRRILQGLHYTYDPVGNITQIRDNAHKIIFNHNTLVEPESRYTYDPLYRLVEATGREHNAMTPCHYSDGDKRQKDFIDLTDQPTANGQALCNYTETYTYDKSSNLTRIHHHNRTLHQQWTRYQDYEPGSNRILYSLGKNQIPNQGTGQYEETLACSFEDYGSSLRQIKHDNNGNIIKLPHLPQVGWDFKNQLVEVQLNIGNNPNRAYYQYDAGGQRVRKTVVKNGRTEERIYLGNYEIYIVSNGSGPTLRRDTLHVMDGQERVALIEVEKDPSDPANIRDTRARYQLTNHLGSAVLEVDDSQQAKLISYEEYYPYGCTAYLAGKNETEAKRKRYRYSGKERDDETGLYYYGARYYAPWLGRWLSCDTSDLSGGANLYTYVDSNPINKVDPSGSEWEWWETTIEGVRATNEWVSEKTYGTGEKIVNVGEYLIENFDIRNEHVRGYIRLQTTLVATVVSTSLEVGAGVIMAGPNMLTGLQSSGENIGEGVARVSEAESTEEALLGVAQVAGGVGEGALVTVAALSMANPKMQSGSSSPKRTDLKSGDVKAPQRLGNKQINNVGDTSIDQLKARVSERQKPPGPRKTAQQKRLEQRLRREYRAETRGAARTDPNQPAWVKGYLENQMRQKGPNPAKWKNPPGLEAGHPHGKRFADYGNRGGVGKFETMRDNSINRIREAGQEIRTPRVYPLP